MSSATIFQIQSGVILAMMYYGVSIRKTRKSHIKVMATVISLDILLILQIELSRSAVAKAVSYVKNTQMLNIHISIAVTTVILYFALIYTGRKILKNELNFKPFHKYLGMSTVVMRTLTFITSYWAV